MISYPNIGPDLIRFGRFRIRWYGVMYLLGFYLGRVILRRLCKQKFLRMAVEAVDDLLIWLFAGMLIGARTFYMLVYYESTESAPFQWYTPFAVWEGGLAFHGGAIGMFVALAWFARRHKVRFLNLGDALTLSAPLGIALGRIGNFINGELYGRETLMPWAMRFPQERDWQGKVLSWTTPRHPSQIYEMLGEGLLTFAVVWLVKRRARHQGVITAAGVMWYACARFVVEFFREKDEQMAYYFGWMTMGQILSVLMFGVGVWLLIYCRRRNVPVDAPGAGSAEDGAPAQ